LAVNKTTLTVVAIAGIVLAALIGGHIYRINKVNPLFANCRSSVKVGMTTDEVKSICGKPLISARSYQFSSFGYQETLVSDEHLKIDFEDSIVVRVRTLRD
jgi:hypothetical protein